MQIENLDGNGFFSEGIWPTDTASHPKEDENIYKQQLANQKVKGGWMEKQVPMRISISKEGNLPFSDY